MFCRSHLWSCAAVLVLASATWAQIQPPQTGPTQTPAGGPQSPSPTTGPPSPSPTTVPGYPGAIPQEQSDLYTEDKDFVRNAAETSATEVHLGKLAQDKGSTDQVKDLGKRMVEANTQTSQQLQQAATALKIQVSNEPPRKAKKAGEKLAKLSGTAFDRAYVKLATDEQKQAVKQFDREAKNGKAQGLKDFAAKRLPAEQEREKQAEDLASAAPGTDIRK